MIARHIVHLFVVLSLAPAAALANGDRRHAHPQARPHVPPAAVACYRKVQAPPVTRTVYDRVLVSEGKCETRVVPAVHGWRQSVHVVEPGGTRLVETPPVHGLVSVARPVAPGRVASKYGRWAGDDYRCDVATPPVYAMETKAAVVAPGRTWVEHTPPVTAVAREKVILYPEHVRRFCTPPVYRVVARQVVVAPGGWYWRPVEGTAGCRR